MLYLQVPACDRLVPAAGFEPATSGLGRSIEEVHPTSPNTTKSVPDKDIKKSEIVHVSPHKDPNTPKSGPVVATFQDGRSQTDSDRTRVNQAWPDLPDHIRETIITLINSAGRQNDA